MELVSEEEGTVARLHNVREGVGGWQPTEHGLAPSTARWASTA